jgi:hypothetical protein
MFPLDDIYLGPHSFGQLHRLDGVIWHTGEESGFSRDYAVATANWQKSNPGSYNFRIYDGGVMLNVPYREASGGINPSSVSWAPGRFPFLERDLPRGCPVNGCGGAYRNPTMHHLQVSFVGRTADLPNGPDNYITNARRLIDWLATHPDRGPAPLVHSKHAHWQTNRSDPGDWIFHQLTPLPDTATEVPVLTRPVREKWAIPSGTTFYTAGPNLGDRKVFTANVELWSNGETTDGSWRRVEYGAEELWIWAERRSRVIEAIPGTRNPVSGYGNPTLSGVPLDSWQALKQQAVKDLLSIGLRANADAEALEAKQP